MANFLRCYLIVLAQIIACGGGAGLVAFFTVLPSVASNEVYMIWMPLGCLGVSGIGHGIAAIYGQAWSQSLDEVPWHLWAGIWSLSVIRAMSACCLGLFGLAAITDSTSLIGVPAWACSGIIAGSLGIPGGAFEIATRIKFQHVYKNCTKSSARVSISDSIVPFLSADTLVSPVGSKSKFDRAGASKSPPLVVSLSSKVDSKQQPHLHVRFSTDAASFEPHEGGIARSPGASAPRAVTLNGDPSSSQQQARSPSRIMPWDRTQLLVSPSDQPYEKDADSGSNPGYRLLQTDVKGGEARQSRFQSRDSPVGPRRQMPARSIGALTAPNEGVALIKDVDVGTAQPVGAGVGASAGDSSTRPSAASHLGQLPPSPASSVSPNGDSHRIGNTGYRSFHASDLAQGMIASFAQAGSISNGPHTSAVWAETGSPPINVMNRRQSGISGPVPSTVDRRTDLLVPLLGGGSILASPGEHSLSPKAIDVNGVNSDWMGHNQGHDVNNLDHLDSQSSEGRSLGPGIAHAALTPVTVPMLLPRSGALSQASARSSGTGGKFREETGIPIGSKSIGMLSLRQEGPNADVAAQSGHSRSTPAKDRPDGFGQSDKSGYDGDDVDALDVGGTLPSNSNADTPGTAHTAPTLLLAPDSAHLIYPEPDAIALKAPGLALASGLIASYITSRHVAAGQGLPPSPPGSEYNQPGTPDVESGLAPSLPGSGPGSAPSSGGSKGSDISLQLPQSRESPASSRGPSHELEVASAQELPFSAVENTVDQGNYSEDQPVESTSRLKDSRRDLEVSMPVNDRGRRLPVGLGLALAHADTHMVAPGALEQAGKSADRQLHGPNTPHEIDVGVPFDFDSPYSDDEDFQSLYGSPGSHRARSKTGSLSSVKGSPRSNKKPIDVADTADPPSPARGPSVGAVSSPDRRKRGARRALLASPLSRALPMD